MVWKLVWIDLEIGLSLVWVWFGIDWYGLGFGLVLIWYWFGIGIGCY
jgi:hypothetical protein